MIEIAENTLVKIAESIVANRLNLWKLFEENIIREQLEDGEIEILTPFHFVEGLK